MSTVICLDIESIPSPEALAREAPDDYLMSGVASNWKPETVEEHRKKRAAKWKEDAPKVAALDWRMGQICAVGTTLDGFNGRLVQSTNGNTEHDLLCATWDRLAMPGARLAGFCLRSFDLPYLLGRSAVLGVPVPKRWNTNRYDHREVIDWADILCNYGGFSTASWTLERYASVFQLPVEPFGSGADVWGWHQAGDWDSITKHLSADLAMTAALHQRCAPAFGLA